MPLGYEEKRMENQRRPIYWPEHIKTVEDAEEYLSWCKQSYATAERFFRSSESDSAAVYGPYELDLKKKAVQKAQEILNSMNGATGGTKELALEKIVREEIRRRLNEAKKMGYGPAKGMYENKDSHTPPENVRAAARRGLELRKKHGKGGLSTQEAGEQGIGSGVARASNLASGGAVSTETLRRMVAFFSRHRKNKSGGEDDAGYIAWLLWGGDPGEAWAKRELADSNQPVD
jgi:hypothetical protein